MHGNVQCSNRSATCCVAMYVLYKVLHCPDNVCSGNDTRVGGVVYICQPRHGRSSCSTRQCEPTATCASFGYTDRVRSVVTCPQPDVSVRPSHAQKTGATRRIQKHRNRNILWMPCAKRRMNQRPVLVPSALSVAPTPPPLPPLPPPLLPPPVPPPVLRPRLWANKATMQVTMTRTMMLAVCRRTSVRG